MSEGLSISAALAAVMAELPAIGKERHQGSDGGIQYAYRGIEQVTREVQTLFAKHGVVVVPLVDHLEVIDIVVNGKPWTDTRLGVTYTLVGPDGSTLTARTVGIGRDNSDKGANKAMTQAFKYLLLQVLCISDAKDDTDGQTHVADGQRARRQPAASAGATNGEAPSAAQTKKAMALFAQIGVNERDERLALTSAYLGRDVGTWKDVSKQEAITVIDKLEQAAVGT